MISYTSWSLYIVCISRILREFTRRKFSFKYRFVLFLFVLIYPSVVHDCIVTFLFRNETFVCFVCDSFLIQIILHDGWRNKNKKIKRGNHVVYRVIILLLILIVIPARVFIFRCLRMKKYAAVVAVAIITIVIAVNVPTILDTVLMLLWYIDR